MELSKGLHVDEYGNLISTIEWDLELHSIIVTGVKKLQNLLILEEV